MTAPHEPHPPASWPGWAKAAEPLRAYLATPQGRTWPELHAWRQGEGLTSVDLLNRLAWLENKGLVVSTGEGARVRWAATGQASNAGAPRCAGLALSTSRRFEHG